MFLKHETVKVGLEKFRDVMNFPIGQTTVDTWIEDLSDLPDPAVEAAFNAVRKTFKPRFNGDRPTPGVLREWILKHITKSDSSAFNECLNNASQMQSRYCTTGKNGELIELPIKWSSPLVKAAFEQFGGVKAFNSMLEEQLPTARAQFRNMYNQIQLKAQGQDSLDLKSENVISISEAKQRHEVAGAIKFLSEGKAMK